MRRVRARSTVFASILVLLASGVVRSSRLPQLATGTPQQITASGFDLVRLNRIDDAVGAAIADGKLPGAVIAVGRGDHVVLTRAYGNRALVPTREPMTEDTIFDLASLTKVVATTTSVMMLVESGQVRITDPVTRFIPECGKNGKDRITIRDLMTHMSGLPPDLSLKTSWTGAATAIAMACDETLTDPPGRKFVYSDINFILLAEVVKRVSKLPLDQFAADRVFAPLGMRDTMFNPPASLRGRIAPTEKCASDDPVPCDPASGGMLRGVVHDPTSRRMGGVAGHAGVFSTAADLSRFCRMLLDGGAIGDARVLSPLTIGRMTSPATPASETNVRGLGWDIDSSYSSNRGEFFPIGSFGHTGFTGTSLWIDPATRVFVVFLSNRVHPDGKGDVTPLRANIASIVASSLVDIAPEEVRALNWSRPRGAAPASQAAPAGAAPVLAGIDVLRAGGFAEVKGLRIGLLTNHTGRARDGQSTIDLLATAPGVTVVSLFSPEHGIRGILDASVPSTRDDKTGLPIHSLYGDTERPTPAMLDGIDAIVIDLQDVGTRFYTYMTTMAYVMEAVAARKIKVIVLDRPNPIGGLEIDGPALDASAVGFTGYFPAMPIRHGMTIGELARLFNARNKIGVDLSVVAMKNWRRDAWFDETGLPWVNPSPNMRNLYAAALYPGIGAFESTSLSVGRGTDTPFEQIGAPWIDEVALTEALNHRGIPGVRFYPVRFTPASSTFAHQECHGVFITITDRSALPSVRVGVEIVSALVRQNAAALGIEKAGKLFGSAAAIARIKAGDDPAAIAASWNAADAAWRQLRSAFLLY